MIKEDLNKEEKKASNGSPSGASTDNMIALQQVEAISRGGRAQDVKLDGHKFGIPELPLASNAHMKYRYEPLVKQVTNLLMKDGKLSRAQRVGSSVHLLALVAFALSLR